MTEQLRWDHDRQVGESYKDYAIRQRGMARAAEVDRDAAVAEAKRLRAERDVVLEIHHPIEVSLPPQVLTMCSECDLTSWPCPTVRALGVEA